MQLQQMRCDGRFHRNSSEIFAPRRSLYPWLPTTEALTCNAAHWLMHAIEPFQTKESVSKNALLAQGGISQKFGPDFPQFHV